MPAPGSPRNRATDIDASQAEGARQNARACPIALQVRTKVRLADKRKMAKALAFLCFALTLLPAAPARAERIFYRASLWLETSPPVQHLSLVGVLQAWERLARIAEREVLPARQQAFVQLHRCLGRRGYATPALLERLTAFSLENPDGVYYSLSDFAAEALRPLCPEATSSRGRSSGAWVRQLSGQGVIDSS